MDIFEFVEGPVDELYLKVNGNPQLVYLGRVVEVDLVGGKSAADIGILG